MIDLSDGLSSDLRHICRESNVGARIYDDRLPIHPDLAHHFPSDECLYLALNGGEDFELLFTVSPQNSGDIPGTCIGEITYKGIEIVQDGVAHTLEAKGYEHFDLVT